MRHAREIDDHRLAADGLAEAERQLDRRIVVIGLPSAIRADKPSRASRSAIRCRWRCVPATTATRADTALIERAMSSARPITRDDLMPGAGSSSYSVTTGPGRALMISPLTPKSSSTLSSDSAFSSISSVEGVKRSLALRRRQERERRQYEAAAGAARRLQPACGVALRARGCGSSSSSSSSS